ncbi:MAG: hypothetical protein JWN27_748 [Candidatus Eremiobacteraeota bacterium]|nr:hypothetical protein [Candidatus Eremiobacteraeota bacterium]
MFEAIFVAYALSASPSPMPAASPSPTPLREIGRVRSRALCTTLRENVAPTLAKLIEGDARIVAGRSTFVKMGKDHVLKDDGHLELDRIALGATVHNLARSIIAADTLLADAKRFPAKPQTDDERDAAKMKRQLQAVVDDQKLALNLFSDLLETDLRAQMRHDLPDGIGRATAVQPAVDANADATREDGLFGHTVYDRFAAEAGRYQDRIAKVEFIASDAVHVALADCRSPSPPPGP